MRHLIEIDELERKALEQGCALLRESLSFPEPNEPPEWFAQQVDAANRAQAKLRAACPLKDGEEVD